MAGTFDPYHMWMGIPPKDQPPNYYRLLALELFEGNSDVIEGAADQRMAHIRTFQTGENSAISQRILNELSVARLCLLDPKKKTDYDRRLREELARDRPNADPFPGISMGSSAANRASMRSSRAAPRPPLSGFRSAKVLTFLGLSVVAVAMLTYVAVSHVEKPPLADNVKTSSKDDLQNQTAKLRQSRIRPSPEPELSHIARSAGVENDQTNRGGPEPREVATKPLADENQPTLNGPPVDNPRVDQIRVTSDDDLASDSVAEDRPEGPAANAADQSAQSSPPVSAPLAQEAQEGRDVPRETANSANLGSLPPLPSGDDLIRARQLVFETFEDELAKDDKVAAIQTLLKAANDNRDDPVGQAALLLIAIEVATDAGDLRLAFEGYDALASRFAYDALAAKATAMEGIAREPGSAESRAVAVNVALKLVDEAAQAKQFEVGERACKAAQVVAGKLKDASLRRKVTAKRKEFEKRRKQYDVEQTALAEARRTLQHSPDDQAANQLIGKHLCFDQNDWPTGLKHLAKVASEKLRTAAAKDLFGAEDAAGQVALGDRWWDLAESADAENDEVGFRSRAVFWYAKAVADLRGLAKGKVEKRLAGAHDLMMLAAIQQGGDGGKYVDVVLAEDVTLRLVKVPSSSDGKVGPFYLGQTEVTQQQWQSVMASNPSDAGGIDPKLPVNMVTLADCDAFCDALARTAIGRRFNIRLPTEAEFVHACYSGASPRDAYPRGIVEYAWCRENAGGKLHPVKAKKATPWGLFDLLGNVWEREAGQELQLIGGSVFEDPALLLNGLPITTGITVDRAANFGFRVAADLK